VLSNFKGEKYLKKDCQIQARKFSKSKFIKEFQNFIMEKWKGKQNA